MNKTIEAVNIALTKAHLSGMEVLAVDMISSHPDDWYLLKVLVRRINDSYEPFVTYLFNAQFASFNNGHYFSEMLPAAKDFAERR